MTARYALSPSRTLADITANALLTDCAECWPGPGVPCKGGGMHVARLARARRRGLLSAEDMTIVVAAVVASMVPVIVTGGTQDRQRGERAA